MIQLDNLPEWSFLPTALVSIKPIHKKSLNWFHYITFNLLAPIHVHIDASHYAVAAAVLLQPDSNGVLSNIGPRKFDVHQQNWDIHVKKGFWDRSVCLSKISYFPRRS